MTQTIKTGQDIRAKVDAGGTDVNIEINGDEVVTSTGADDYKSLVTPAWIPITTPTIWTPSATFTWIIDNIKITNTSASQRTVTFYKGGTTAQFQWGTPIVLAPGESAEWSSAGWTVYDSNGIPKFSSAIFPRYVKGAAPGNPPAGSVYTYMDVAGLLHQKDEFGIDLSIPESGLRDQNLIIDGNFDYAQRQAPGTLTTWSNTTGRAYGADRWGVTNENASIQYIRTDTSVTPQTGLQARMFGTYSKITATGKLFISQVIAGSDCMHLRGKTVRLQMKLKASAAKTLRIFLLENANAATLDAIAATFISAFGANTVDPTFGTNLNKIAPLIADLATIRTNGLDCAATTTWQRFGATFTLPANYKNLVVVVGTDSQFAAADSFSISEVGLYDGMEIREWSERIQAQQLANCQRFYVKSFPVDSAPIQNFTIAAGGYVAGNAGQAGVVAGVHFGIKFPVQMNKAPTVTLYNPAAANAFLRQVITPSDATATSATSITADGFAVTATGLAAWAKGDAVAINYAADAEI